MKIKFMVMYTTLSDAELIALLNQKDHNAFNEIYIRYSPKILQQVNHMVRDAETTKDLVQELFLSFWNKAAHIRLESNLGGFLYVAAQNSVFNYIQKSKFRSDYLRSLAKFSTELTENTTQVIEERNLHVLIDQEIAKLPVKMRQVFELSRLEHLSYFEIANQLDISEHTVRNQISNSIKILKKKFAPHALVKMNEQL